MRVRKLLKVMISTSLLFFFIFFDSDTLAQAFPIETKKFIEAHRFPNNFEATGDKNNALKLESVRGATTEVNPPSLPIVPGWTNEGNQANASLGRAASTAGDVNGDGYSDVIVGASDYDNGQMDEGRAWLFYGSASGLSNGSSWSAESDQIQANFGWVATTAGDVNGDGYADVMITAHNYDSQQDDVGAVFIYHGSSTGLNSAPAQTLLGEQSGAGFGISAATAGDINGDGYSDIIVGAYQFDHDEENEGKIYIYYGSSSGINATPVWTMESNQADANFGVRVNMAGDVNGDGYSDIIAGSTFYTDSEVNEGAAFVFHGSVSGLNSTPDWEAFGGQADARFSFVNTAGDVNGDGYSDVVVGAGGYDNGEDDEGQIFAYYGSASGLSLTADWTADSDQGGANLGPVGPAGDVNGDGYADLVAAAYLYDNDQNDEGRSFIYYGSNTGLESEAVWTGESNYSNALYGVTVGTAGDVNGDGLAEVVVGASAYTNGQLNEGAAFVYYGITSPPNTADDWRGEGNQSSASFGRGVSIVGDVNGDGYADAVVGAPDYDNGQENEGRAFLYYGSNSGLNLVPAWTAEINQANASFGWAVGPAGDVNGDGYADIVVTAQNYNDAHSGEGAAFVYYGSETIPNNVPDWQAAGEQAGAAFGISASTAGDVNGDGYSDLLVGAYKYDNGQENEGAVYLYYGTASGLSLIPAWSAESNQANANIGTRVSTAGDVNGDGYSDVVIGATYYTDSKNSEGAAFVYHGSPVGLSHNPNWTAYGNQVEARFSFVSTAGDVNGDGYSDILVGAGGFDNGHTDEGQIFAYYGSISGLSTTPNWTADSNQDSANLGPVTAAGDVNGDGYADVIAGAYLYDNGQENEGRAFLFYGSDSGLNATPAWTGESNNSGANYGVTVGPGGDVNGDGYADVIVGAHHYTAGQSQEGAAFLYYGNNSLGNSLLPRQLRTDATTPIAPLGLTDSQTAFNIELNGQMPLGREDVKLEWQVAPFGEAFDGPHAVTGVSSSWTDVLTGNVTIMQQISDLTPATPYHWRARLRYRPGNVLGQSAGRWVHMPWNGWQEQDLRTQGEPCDPVSNGGISRSPQGQVYTGHNIRFTANASGDSPFAYAWKINGNPVGQNIKTLDYIFSTAGTYEVTVLVTNACSQQNISMSVSVSEAGSNLPNLSTSHKTVSLTNVEQGDTLTYTIHLHNNSNTPATATLTDTIPANTIYVADSAESSDGSQVDVDQAIHWQGQVISGTPVIIEFAVTVQSPALGTVIQNIAELDDGVGNRFQLEANSTYNPGYRLSINDGALYTNSRFVNLRYGWNIGDDIESVSFSNDGGFGPEGNTTGWLPINAGDPMYQDWELTTYGHWLLPRTVYVKFRDGSGQQYGPFQDDIIYDEQAPTCTNVQILSETTRTTEGEAGQVIVRAQVDDDNSGVVKLHLSNSADFAEYTEVNVTGSTVEANWTLQPSGQVYVRSVDRAGNTSTIQSAQGEIENGPFKIMLPLILK